MKEVHVISLLGLAYAVILSLITFIFFRSYVIWPILGASVSLFNHSRMIHVTKNKLKVETLALHIIQRYVLYIVVIVFVFFDTQGLEDQIVINSYIFLLLGFMATKIGVYVYHTPLIKKKKEEEVVSKDENVT